jgi:hypothetical protein
MKEFIVREMRIAFEFQKKTVMFVLKLMGYGLRYAFWMLPWILLSIFAARPIISVLKGFADEPPPPIVETEPIPSRDPTLTEPAPDHQWDTFQRRVDSGMRTFDRLARRIGK